MKLTYYGHSCFNVEVNGKNLLFDPFITGNPLASDIDINKIKADYVLLSHGHEDHVGDALTLIQRTGAKLISNFEICMWFNRQGVNNFQPMNIGGKWIFDDFGKVKCVVAVHSSSMPDGAYGGNPMGFIIESSQGNFYYAGDTALTYDMKLIGEYRQIDFAFLPIGDTYTMSADNAIIAADFLNCDTIIGMHYDTLDTIKIDQKQAVHNFNRVGKDLILMEIGKTIDTANLQTAMS